MRVQTISFFLLGFLGSAFGVQRLWNYLARDFTVLPHLTYRRALGLTALWGLLFVVVLTMISGARELMTPGAWEKQGETYRLASQSTSSLDEDQFEKERYKKLEWVREKLLQYADAHEGNFPREPGAAGLAGSSWETPGHAPRSYLYVAGQTRHGISLPLVYEPELAGEARLVLFTDGEIRRMNAVEIAQALPGNER
jgi:hypothetical protein